MNQQELFGVRMDAVTLQQAAARVLEMCAERVGVCRFVVTPNLDHLMELQRNAALRRAYEDASLIVADGFPLLVTARLVGRPLPERVAGSDLVPQIFQMADPLEPITVFLLGAAPGVGDRAAAAIKRRYRGVEIAGVYSPPMGFERDDRENDSILSRIRAARPDLLVVGLGAPKQELWVHRHREAIEASVALCVGATIDFLAGHRSRAPIWMQKYGIEWAHRMAQEPSRLGVRYLRNALGFPGILLREWKKAEASLRGESE